MTMAVSDHFQKTYAQGGYGYVCLPWVSKYQVRSGLSVEHTLRLYSRLNIIFFALNAVACILSF